MVSPDSQSLCMWNPHSCRLPSLGVLFSLGMHIMVSYSSMLYLILRGYMHRRVLHCLVLYPYICLNSCTHWNILYMWSWYCNVNKWGHIYSSMYGIIYSLACTSISYSYLCCNGNPRYFAIPWTIHSYPGLCHLSWRPLACKPNSPPFSGLGLPLNLWRRHLLRQKVWTIWLWHRIFLSMNKERLLI